MSDDWLQECEPFMRTGETPAQCIARQRAETSKALLWFAEERKRVEKLEQENERLREAAESLLDSVRPRFDLQHNKIVPDFSLDKLREALEAGDE